MVFRDILLIYVDVDTQKNPIKNTSVEKWAIENQHIKNFIIHFFTYILYFFLFTLFFLFWKWTTFKSQNAGTVFKVYCKYLDKYRKIKSLSQKMTIYRV